MLFNVVWCRMWKVGWCTCKDRPSSSVAFSSSSFRWKRRSRISSSVAWKQAGKTGRRTVGMAAGGLWACSSCGRSSSRGLPLQQNRSLPCYIHRRHSAGGTDGCLSSAGRTHIWRGVWLDRKTTSMQISHQFSVFFISYIKYLTDNT